MTGKWDKFYEVKQPNLDEQLSSIVDRARELQIKRRRALLDELDRLDPLDPDALLSEIDSHLEQIGQAERKTVSVSTGDYLGNLLNEEAEFTAAKNSDNAPWLVGELSQWEFELEQRRADYDYYNRLIDTLLAMPSDRRKTKRSRNPDTGEVWREVKSDRDRARDIYLRYVFSESNPPRDMAWRLRALLKANNLITDEQFQSVRMERPPLPGEVEKRQQEREEYNQAVELRDYVLALTAGRYSKQGRTALAYLNAIDAPFDLKKLDTWVRTLAEPSVGLLPLEWSLGPRFGKSIYETFRSLREKVGGN